MQINTECPKSEYTAIIDNWIVQQVSRSEVIVWGYIKDDKLERWEDGAQIHTSGIKNRSFTEGDIVTTRNSKYLLGVPLNET